MILFKLSIVCEGVKYLGNAKYLGNFILNEILGVCGCVCLIFTCWKIMIDTCLLEDDDARELFIIQNVN